LYAGNAFALPDPGAERRALLQQSMGAILILGRDYDDFCRLMCDHLCQAGRTVLFVVEENLFPELGFTWRVPDDGTICWNQQRISFRDIDGIISRSYGVPLSREEYDTVDGKYITSEWHALLMAWLYRMPCPVVNRLRPELWYRSQLQPADLLSLVPDLRFKLPRFLVTTRPEEARTFWESTGQQIYYIPANEVTRYPVFDQSDLDKLETLSATLPLRLTERIAGTPCDAFVAGEQVTLVGPEGVLRRSVPPDLSAACTHVGSTLDLAFYRLSLVEDDHGEWYCLALDRLPQLLRQPAEVRAEIARSLADLLAGGGRHS
jgi:hypothetical protein